MLCVMPAMAYATNKWSLTIGLIHMIRAMQKAMEIYLLYKYARSYVIEYDMRRLLEKPKWPT